MGFKDSLGYKTFSKKNKTKKAASHVNKIIMGKCVLSTSTSIMELQMKAVAPPLKERASSSQSSKLMTSDLALCRGGSRLSLLGCLDVVYFHRPTNPPTA